LAKVKTEHLLSTQEHFVRIASRDRRLLHDWKYRYYPMAPYIFLEILYDNLWKTLWKFYENSEIRNLRHDM